MRDTIHHMGRRCRNWDYCGRGCYLITITLNDRSHPLLGEVRRAIDGAAQFLPTELGRRVEEHAHRIPEHSPDIEVRGVQCMPEHLHMVLRVRNHMAKPLGEHLRGFKIGCTKIARKLLPPIDGQSSHSAIDGREQGEAARGKGLFADGFVDTILFDDEAVARGLAYMHDNPRGCLCSQPPRPDSLRYRSRRHRLPGPSSRSTRPAC